MANQSFNRGKETYQATASLAFVGNTKHTVPYMLRHSHLFESIPLGFIKGAFLDRMHLYSPGWEVKILKEAVFTDGYGFIVDYLAEVLRYFRRYDFTDRLDAYFEMDGSLTARDKLAIRKTFSGLMKILYPHQQINEQEAMELLDYAMEGRRRVKDQLYIIDETFRDQPTDFQFKVISTGAIVEVNTLEKQNLEAEYQQHSEGQGTIVLVQENTSSGENSGEVNPDHTPKQIVIKDNQTGISYRRLFGDYIKGAKKIYLTDSYIRYYYQFKNLMEFAAMIAQTKQPDEEVNLHVTTWFSPDKQQESINNFLDLSANLQDLGIQLTWEFQDIHDRHIVTDNGWQIQLGRGLDIFVAPEGRFDPAEVFQEKRKCKNCTITYLRNK
jgi:ATP-dependent Lon protease